MAKRNGERWRGGWSFRITVALLIAGAAYVWRKDAARRNVDLLTAAEAGHVATVDRLLRAGANINARWVDDSTPLFVAARAGHAAVVERLLEAGADPHESHTAMGSPLHTAVIGGRVDVVRLLLARGVDANARSAAGDPMLCLAAVRGCETVRMLLEAGANPNATCADGTTPLMLADDNPAAVRLLLAYGARPRGRNETRERVAIAR